MTRTLPLILLAAAACGDKGDGATTETSSPPTETDNAAPSAATVTITPETPLANVDLMCSGTATDPDGDALTYTYAWELDGDPWTGATGTTAEAGDTVLASETEGGQIWTCQVTASDGIASSPTAAVAVLIVDFEPREFGTCGATGRLGPEQADCDFAYGGTPLAGEVTVDAGLQSWTAPYSGRYRIGAAGAQGASGDVSFVGGKGAALAGTFDLVAGDVLVVAVGQMGLGQSSGTNGGGGGGSFVVADGAPLVVAGGGGGTRAQALQDGCPGSSAEEASTASGYGYTHSCALKGTGTGEGGVVSSPSYGSAGAGWNSDGESDPGDYGSDALGAHGGGGWTAGLVGGDGWVLSGCAADAEGGFGGGGSGNGCWGGGGAGGYSGGDGGLVAGGAGSWNAGTDLFAAPGVNPGDGSVTIEVAP